MGVTSLRDIYKTILKDLENIVKRRTDNVRISSGPSAAGLKKKLESYKVIHISHFLCDAVKPVTQLALTFEKSL